jgi:hypothetical protein
LGEDDMEKQQSLKAKPGQMSKAGIGTVQAEIVAKAEIAAGLTEIRCYSPAFNQGSFDEAQLRRERER